MKTRSRRSTLPNRRPAAEPSQAKEPSVNAMLALAVQSLQEIAHSTAREPVSVEQTA